MTKKYRLYRVADQLSPHGFHVLKPFESPPFNEAFEYQNFDSPDVFDTLDERLTCLVQHLFADGGEYFPIDATDRHIGHLYAFHHDKIVFYNARGEMIASIKNLIPYFAIDPPEEIFVILFNTDYTQHYWIGIVPQEDT